MGLVSIGPPEGSFLGVAAFCFKELHVDASAELKWSLQHHVR
jgi:hypothetical protein